MIQKWCKRTLLLLTIISLPCAAFSRVSALPQDKPKWRVGVTAPSFYPVYVSKAYGVNEQENWTSLVFSINQLLDRIDLSNAQQWIPDYDGFGIALNPLTSFTRDQIGED